MQYPTSFLLVACGQGHLVDLQASHAEDDMSISLAQQAAAAQQSYAAASECSYTDCLTLRRIALPIATPLPHALAHTIANITRPFAYIANAHDVAKRRLRLHQPLPWLRLKPCADVTAAVRTRVCSSTTATLAARLSSSPFFCRHYGSPRCAHAIIARVYAVYCSRVQDSLSAMMAVTALAYFHEGSRQLAHGQACEAARSFQRAIDAGHAESHAALSFMHYGTYRGVPPCHSKVFQLASAGAKMGCIHSKGALADCLRTGIGTAVDVAEAFRLATESADAGSLYGQHSLACAYRRGIGISQNDAIAARLFLLAAEQGEVHSHDWLGNMYRPRAPSFALKSCSVSTHEHVHRCKQGAFFERSEEEALRWWRRAADMGYEPVVDKLASRMRRALREGLPSVRAWNDAAA